MPTTVTLSLISHTNVGKTTLARTLLRRDIGEVRDEAHVTDASEAHVLIETGQAVLRLWDTPGFGDSARLMRRLRRESDPLGWFLHQLWDRFMDRPLWCSQEAVRNIKDEADVVLYLVNAAEAPQDAGYVRLELELLGWIDRPVLLLLNQVGESGADLETRWAEFIKAWPVVRGLLSLDAFTRCWTDEGVLLQRVAKLLQGPEREAMDALLAAWNERNRDVFQRACAALAAYLAAAAVDLEPLSPDDGEDPSDDGMLGFLGNLLKQSPVGRRRAMARLNERLDRSTQQLMAQLIEAHGLVGASAAKIEKRLQDFQLLGSTVPINETSGALAGAVLSGALGGLAADALTGGLSLGGGMIAGGILGALGGSALARGYRWVTGDRRPAVRWSAEFLDLLFRQVLLRYLSVAHFGRGRGAYRDLEYPEHWSRAVEAATEQFRDALHTGWKQAESPGRGTEARLAAELEQLIEQATARILKTR